MFIVHEHSGVQPIHLFSCHPLILLITHRETGDSDYLHTLQALRLMATISCPSILTYMTLCFPSTLLAGSRFISFRILSNFFRVTVGTQASDFSTAYLQRKFFPIRGHLILLNMFLSSLFNLRFHLKYFWLKIITPITSYWLTTP